MRSNKLPVLAALLVFGSLLLASCQSSTPGPGRTPSVPTRDATVTGPTAASTAVPATSTPETARTLVLCLTNEPQTLYLYGGNSRSMWSVLEAVYDGPIDTRSYETQPVILQKIPHLEDGDAVLQPVNVKDGDPVVDLDGNLVALKSGLKVLPSGCSSPDCAVTWDGQSELVMDQLVVEFKLLPDLKWSDGQPLTADDSVFSYTVASDPATPTSKYLTDRTSAYEAVDAQTVRWTGMPGYFEPRFGTFFWIPLPHHALKDKSPQALLTDPQMARAPLGWGPYVIQDWVAGDHITLQKNPNYFRAAEGLPGFDTLVYRFVGEAADGDMNALLAGECDAVDQNPQFLEMLPGLLQREAENKLKTYVGQGPEWEHLDFGIQPASADHPSFFGDVRTRQGFAYCIDRAALNTNFLYNRSSIPNSFLPPDHPLYAQGLPEYPFDPAQGQKLLDEVGWKDTDNDPATPRIAQGVSGVPDGTPFSITYLTTQAALRQQTAEAAAASLRGCGIEVKVEAQNPGALFAPGPDGPVFGRKFDLVQFSWEASARPNCLLYTTQQIPATDNQWIGANVSGYSSPAFDAACISAYDARPLDAAYTASNQQVQEIFASDLPVIPLYTSVKVAIARPALCGLAMDVTARSIFSGLESITLDGVCPQ